MFGLRPLEIGIILVVALLIFGPKSLPALGRAVGKAIREFRDASSKFSDALTQAGREESANRHETAPPRLAAEARPADLPKIATPAESVPSAPAKEVNPGPTHGAVS
ncbi:twin-arginine translocase TatA/TatE family subunit [Candidatus Poribacteria bacterium]|nr:twin-arginine translocase TatA/TatE family subunit [Candidatus Poribacteria bacterium]